MSNNDPDGKKNYLLRDIDRDNDGFWQSVIDTCNDSTPKIRIRKFIIDTLKNKIKKKKKKGGETK